MTWSTVWICCEATCLSLDAFPRQQALGNTGARIRSSHLALSMLVSDDALTRQWGSDNLELFGRWNIIKWWEQKSGLPAWRCVMGGEAERTRQSRDSAPVNGPLGEGAAVETCSNDPGPTVETPCQSRRGFSFKWRIGSRWKHALPRPHHVTPMVAQKPAATDAVCRLWLFIESQTAAVSFTSWNLK